MMVDIWDFDIIIFWYYQMMVDIWYHHITLILSNDCRYIFRMPAYGDILRFWYHDTPNCSNVVKEKSKKQNEKTQIGIN